MADNRINIVISAKDQASGQLRDVSREIDRTGDTAKRSSGLMDGFKHALGGAAVALGVAGVAAGTAAAVFGLKFNSSVEQAETKLMAFMKDGEQVARTLAWVKEEAAATQFSFTDMADAAANLTPVAKMSGKSLQELIKQAEILAALNPAEGLTGAVFSLREALSGDWVSIVDRFNLPRKRINELKEQGVPAMEIISRTLQEMGIDYSLVSKQGQTAAARFEQLKDKLNMLAGAATKPIFDKLGEGLEALNSQDFEGLEKKFGAIGQAYIDMWDLLTTGEFKDGMFAGMGEMWEEDGGAVQWIKGLHEAYKELFTFVKPAVDELVKVWNEEFMPAMEKFMKELGPDLKILGIALGAVLMGIVYALAGIVKGLAFVIDKGTDFIDFIKDNFNISMAAGTEAIEAFSWTINNLPEIFGYVIGEITEKITDFVTKDIPSFINGLVNWFSQLPNRIAGALAGMWGAAVGAFDNLKRNAIIWASQTVSAIIHLFANLPGAISSALSKAFGGAQSQVNDFMSRITSGFNSGRRNAIGTAYSSGGMTLVGEHGPELVNLPQGAQVTQAWKTRSDGVSAAQAGNSVTNNIYGNITLGDASAVDRFMDRLDRSGQLAARGLAA